MSGNGINLPNLEDESEDAGAALRVLAANIMRVLRGAGKPYDLPNEAAAFVEACDRYFSAHKRLPDLKNPLHRALNTFDFLRGSTPVDIARWEADGSMDRLRAINAICRSALQISASRLLGQTNQEERGEEELLRGIKDFKRPIGWGNA